MADQCKSCGSWRLLRLNGETCLHFPGVSGLSKAPIFSFGKITVCLDCGAMESIISHRELLLIRGHAADVQNLSDQPDEFDPVADPNPSPDNPLLTKHLP
jgi:hypothetical protein